MSNEVAQICYQSYNIQQEKHASKEMQMTTTTIQAVVAAAQQLSPTEQFEVIQVLTRVLQHRYVTSDTAPVATSPAISLPPSVRRTPTITSLADFAADFWPDDETADDINTYIAQQRAADRMRDLPDGDL